MSERLRYRVKVDTPLPEEACESVPQVMEVKILDGRLPERSNFS
jgi:hypothetical protein